MFDTLTSSDGAQTSRFARSHRRPDIQGLRGVAVLLVACFHADLPVPGGFVGVDVFFVVSGFVITGLLMRQWADFGRLDLRSFYIRRIRRLLPALSLVLGATCLASALLEPPNGQQQTTAQTALAAVTLSANIAIPRLGEDYFAPLASTNPLLHTWSLSAEEQFYLVFPALLLVGLALTGRKSGLSGAILIVGGVSAASLILLLWATYAPMPDGWLRIVLNPFYSSLTRAWEFGAGALVALATSTLRRCRHVVLVGAGIAGCVTVIASALLITTQTTFPGAVALVPVAGSALMLAAGLQTSNLVVRALSVRPLVALGDLSYSWYLWHWPVISFGRLLAPEAGWIPFACAVASLAPAYLSYRLVENPVRFSPRLRGRALIGVLTAAVALPLMVAGALGLGSRLGWGQDWALGSHVVLRRGCETGAFDPVRCRWPVPSATGSVLLLGDSQSWAIADGVIPAATRLGLDTIVASHNGCPFVSLPAAADQPPALRPECGPRNEEVLRFAVDHEPRVAVIANSFDYPSVPGDRWRGGLSAVVRLLRSTGAGVVLVSVTPVADDESRRLSLLLEAPGDRSTSLEDHLNRHRASGELLLEIAKDNPGTIIFDPATVLCDDRRCAVARNGVQFYSDRNHLSRAGALLLEDGLRGALKRAMQPTSAARQRQ